MYAKVIVDITNSEVDKVFDYKIPSFLPVSKGDMVLVPFGKRSIMGFVLDIADISLYDESKIKEIKEILLPQIIKSNILQLIHEMKTQYYLKYVDIIKLVIPSEIRNGKIKTQFERNIRIKDFEKFEDYLKTIRRNSKNPVLVYNHLTNKAEDNYTNLCKLYSSACINKLLELEILEETKTIKNRLTQGTTYIQKNITLNSYQTNANLDINSLMIEYYAALAVCDQAKLVTLVTDPSAYNDMTPYEQKSQIITHYSNINCYTVAGNTADTTILYVTCNINIAGVQSAPMNISQFYIVKTAEGYKINNSPLDEATTTYINDVSASADVQELYRNVKANIDSCLASDPTFAEFYNKIYTAE